MKTTLLFIVILAAGCVPATPPAQTSPQTSSPVVGVTLDAELIAPRSVRLILQNGSNDPIGYNLCSSGLQRLEGSAWTAVPTNIICTMELRTLNPGFDATFTHDLPSTLAAGQYRFVTNVENPAGMNSIASDSFAIR